MPRKKLPPTTVHYYDVLQLPFPHLLPRGVWLRISALVYIADDDKMQMKSLTFTPEDSDTDHG